MGDNMMSLLLSIRLSMKDYERLEKMAGIYRMSLTEYVEKVVLKDLHRCGE